jgi:hypothetical protein
VIRALNRYEGRLFTAEGYLFLVVHADEASGTASVSCRMGEETQIIDMPYAEVVRKFHHGPPPLLDNLHGPAAAKRVSSDADGWHFQSREGRMGPFRTRGETERELIRHVLLMQSAGTAATRRGDFAPMVAAS